MRLFLISAVLFAGCSETDNPIFDLDMGLNHPTISHETATSRFDENSEVWVCHHPGTKQHGTECVELMYPKGCYVKGDDTKFCWLLNEKDCNLSSGIPLSVRENFCQSSL